MYEVQLHRPETNDKSTPDLLHLHGVVDAFGEAECQQVRVYRTYVPKHDKWLYEFITTSKEVHLGLGRLSKKGQLHLASLLHLEFVKGECSQLLLRMPGQDARKQALLVTLALPRDSDEAKRSYHLSPAH